MIKRYLSSDKTEAIRMAPIIPHESMTYREVCKPSQVSVLSDGKRATHVSIFVIMKMEQKL